jgi:hypothetical protein
MALAVGTRARALADIGTFEDPPPPPPSIPFCNVPNVKLDTYERYRSPNYNSSQEDQALSKAIRVPSDAEWLSSDLNHRGAEIRKL